MPENSYEAIRDEHPVFQVDTDLREIKADDTNKTIAVQFDKRSQIVTFRVAKLFDNVDHTGQQANIHYLNKSGTGDVVGAFSVDVDEEDPEYLLVRWLVSETATPVAGTLRTSLEFCVQEGDQYVYRWFTKPAKFEIAENIEVTDEAQGVDQTTLMRLHMALTEVEQATEQVKGYGELMKQAPYCIGTQAEMAENLNLEPGMYVMTFGIDDVGDSDGVVWHIVEISDVADGDTFVELDTGYYAVKLNGFGGSGGGGTGAVLPTLQSDFEGTSQICNTGDSVTVPYYANSPNLGRGVITVTVNGAVYQEFDTKLGNGTVVLSGLTKGTKTVQIVFTDKAGLMSDPVQFSVVVGSLEITSDFDTTKDYVASDLLRYFWVVDTISTDAIKTTITIDGVATVVASEKGINYYTMPTLAVGIHTVTVQATAGEYTSNILSFNLVIIDSTTLFLSTTFNQLQFEEGVPVPFDYRISMKDQTTFTAEIYLDEALQKTVNAKSGTNSNTFYDLSIGSHNVKIVVTTLDGLNTATLERTFEITESTYEAIGFVTQGLVANFDPKGKSNIDQDRTIWTATNDLAISAELYNFGYTSKNGWSDGELMCNGKAYARIPIAPFANNAEYGYTVEVCFRTRDIGDLDAKALYCKDASTGVGFAITPQYATLSSLAHAISTAIPEDTQTWVSFVVDRSNKKACIYLNGVRTEPVTLTDTGSVLESFQHNGYIYINAGLDKNGNVVNIGSCEILKIRLYERALESQEIVQNMISDYSSRTEQAALYRKNFEDSISTVYLEGDVSGLTKDKNYVPISFRYIPSMSEHGEALTLPECQIAWQGTSSMQYPFKNYKIKLMLNGSKYKYQFMPGAIEESTFCLKADYASPEHWHNTVIAKLANGMYKEKTPAQQLNESCRTAINGHLCQVYLNGVWQGIYNFNNDKGNTDTFGMDTSLFPNCMRFEVTANTDTTAGAFVAYDPAAYTDAEGNVTKTETEYYQEDFERNYPEDDVADDYGYDVIKALVEWVDGADDETFRAEFEEHFNLEFCICYILNVLLLGMVDNLGKNMMIATWDGQIFYPEFYDCDTIVGYDNSANLRFDSDIEIEAGIFNTSNSNLWSKFLRVFLPEIKARWAEQRLSVYTVDNIMGMIEEHCSCIGANQYNMDCETKYFTNPTYMYMYHGDQIEFARRWLTERILYLDTLLDCKIDTSRSITIRTNYLGTVSFSVQTYSPLYLEVVWRNGVSEKKRIGRGETVVFSYDMPTATDQEVLIYCAQHIKSLGDLSSMRPTVINISEAAKLIEIVARGATALQSLVLPENSFVQKIDVRNCSGLGQSINGATGQTVLDVTNCPQVKYVDIFGTNLYALSTNPDGGNLEEIYYPYSIQDVTLINQQNLIYAIVPYSKSPLQYASIVSVHIEDCPNLKSVYTTDSYQANSLASLYHAMTVYIHNTGIGDFEFDSNGEKEVGIRFLVGQQSCQVERVLIIGGVVTLYGDEVGLEANVGVDEETVKNDFDDIYPWSDIVETTIAGRRMVEIPKFWFRRFIEDDYEYWMVSEVERPGYRRPQVFLKPDGTEYDRFLVGKYMASGDLGNRSASGEYPTTGKTRTWFRQQAMAIGEGWSITDIAYYCDVLQPLLVIEFATRNLQDIMMGRVNQASTTTTVATDGGNALIVSNAGAANFRVGDTMSIASKDRTIVSIEAYDDSNMAITLTGDAFTVAAGASVNNGRATRTGQTDGVTGCSGSRRSNTDGRNPFKWRNIENPWGDCNEFVDGVNIQDGQAYVCSNYEQYADDVWTAEAGYYPVGYTNALANGYTKELGYDDERPWARLPTVIGGSTTTYFADYYWYATGARLVLFGGSWSNGANFGPFYWSCNGAFSLAYALTGARLSFRL